jgi:TrmH family RNA methyltransferase
VRQAEGRFVVEGAKLITEALKAGVVIEAVFLDSAAARDFEREAAAASTQAGAAVRELQPGVLSRACDTIAPQPIAAIAQTVDVPLDELQPQPGDLIVVCARVNDPGNLGTIIRSAAGAGAGAVICCAGSVDLYNPKTVRASAGGLFHLPVVAGPDPVEVLERLGGWGWRRWGASATGARVYSDVDLRQSTALVLGNEAAGLAEAVEAHVDGTLRIPLAGAVESLNVATAAAIVCYEAARQRAQAAAREPA